MPASRNIQPCYEDPRDEPGFEADCYPAEVEAAAAAPAGVAELKKKFKAVYARRNACVRALVGLEASDPRRARLIEQTLELTEAIDHLEDVGAPIGFIAEPVMDEDLFTRELVFTHAPVRDPGQPAQMVSSFSIYLPIPLDGLAAKEAGETP